MGKLPRDPSVPTFLLPVTWAAVPNPTGVPFNCPLTPSFNGVFGPQKTKKHAHPSLDSNLKPFEFPSIQPEKRGIGPQKAPRNTSHASLFCSRTLAAAVGADCVSYKLLREMSLEAQRIFIAKARQARGKQRCVAPLEWGRLKGHVLHFTSDSK